MALERFILSAQVRNVRVFDPIRRRQGYKKYPIRSCGVGQWTPLESIEVDLSKGRGRETNIINIAFILGENGSSVEFVTGLASCFTRKIAMEPNGMM